MRRKHLPDNGLVASKRELLEDFCVPITDSVEERLHELQDDEVTLRIYVRSLIKEHLDN